MKMEGLSLHRYHSEQILSLVFTKFMSCLAPSSAACPGIFECGNQTFEYPFGPKSRGCGDPALQLDCDHQLNMTSINISGYQYYLLEHFGHRKEGHVNHMRIVDRNMWGDACNPSTNNRTMEFWSSPRFRISDKYINTSLWGECAEEIKDYMPTEAYALECNKKSWYYSDSNLGTYCKSLVHLPVKNVDKTNLQSLQRIKHGFKIKWSISKGCGSETANKTAIALGCAVGGVALMVALAVLCILYMKRRKRAHTREIRGDYSNYMRSGTDAGYGPMYTIGSLSIFPYQELQQATNFFDENNLLGDGGFGVVYLGNLVDGRSVAVKRLYQESSRTLEQFMNEFVPNGTLSDHLHASRRTLTGLPWATRLNIAIETAQALAYLHSIHPPIIHRDVKSSNILLDEHFRVKVADFGLSRLVPVNVSHVTTAPQGTAGNEISLAKMATDKIRRGVLDELVDPDLKMGRNHEVKITVAAVADLGFELLAIERDFRPTMKEVVARLTEIKKMLRESTESSNSTSSTSISSVTSVQENWRGVAPD
ncbi:hypothetical protein SUGI_0116350 [Cryptomeria japonica]|nr:hypothetical protein SUGI_0116350 [Cryptomeria japonica]